MTAVAHPPAPWLLHGRAIVVPALVRPPHGRPRRTRGLPSRSPGGLLLGSYGPGSTLAYHELLGIGGLAWRGLAPAAWITHAHVDSPVSLAGGRALWAIPKELAEFHWSEAAGRLEVAVSAAGRDVVAVSAVTRPKAIRVPVAGPFAGADGRTRAWALGRLRGAPAHVRVAIPADSPLAALAPRFSGAAVVGDVSLRITAPR